MISIVKKIYSRPFLNETRSVWDIFLYRVTLTLVRLVYNVKFSAELRRTNRFLDQTRGKVMRERRSAFVFANGPSLSQIDLEKIKVYCDEKSFDLIAINSFLSKSAKAVTPTFAVFADNVHFSGGDTQYTRDIETCRELGIHYFVPAKYANSAEEYRHGYCSICDLDSKNTGNITQPAGYYGVTALFAISLAKTIGYEKIYLCGFDNSYFKDFSVGVDNKMKLVHRHYYDNKMDANEVPCLYERSSEFFFDTYRHFLYLEKITKGCVEIKNIAKESYVSSIPRCFDLDVYK